MTSRAGSGSGRPLETSGRFVAVHAVAAVLTALNGLVVGYGAVAFQLFGTGPDSDDFHVAVGGYASAAVLLGLSAGIGFLRDRPPWQGWTTAVVASLFALAAFGSAQDARVAASGPGISGVWDGAGGVVLLPWSWVLVALFVLTLRARWASSST